MEAQDVWCDKALDAFEVCRKNTVKTIYNEEGTDGDSFSFGELTMTLKNGSVVRMGEALVRNKLAMKPSGDEFLKHLYKTKSGNIMRCNDNRGKWSVFDTPDTIEHWGDVGDPVPEVDEEESKVNNEDQEVPPVNREVEKINANKRSQEAHQLYMDEATKKVTAWDLAPNPDPVEDWIPVDDSVSPQSPLKGEASGGPASPQGFPPYKALHRSASMDKLLKLNADEKIRSEGSGFKRQLPFTQPSGSRQSSNHIVAPIAIRLTPNNATSQDRVIPTAKDSAPDDKENGTADLPSKLDDLNL